jgi:hypothetical protein
MPTEDVLATCDGMQLCRSGAFVYIKGQGGNSHNHYASFDFYAPPAVDIGRMNLNERAYAGGIVDCDSGIDYQSIYNGMGVFGKTGTGSVWTGENLSRYTNARPYLVALYGDNQTATTTAGIKVGNDTRTGFMLTGKENDNSLYMGVERISVPLPLHVPIGTIMISRWGDVCVMTLTHLSITTTATDLVNLGTIPVGWRPRHDVPFPFVDNYGSKYPYSNIDANTGNIYLYRDHTNDYQGDGCAIYSTADATTGSAFTTASLNVKGVKKTLIRRNTGAPLQSTMATCTNASGVTGTCYVYRLGNFVFGHSLGFSAPISSVVTDQNLFQVPVEYTPSERVYSTGFGAYYLNGQPPTVDWQRCRYVIDPDGWVKISTSTKAPVTNCTFCGYYYCNS